MLQNGVFLMSCLLVCCSLCKFAVSFALLAGSDTVVQSFLHRNMEIDAAAQTRDRHGTQQPWLEYSYWQGQEWVKVYTPGEPQLWRQNDDVPALPDGAFRVWKPAVPLQDEAQGNDDWQSERGHQSQLSPFRIRGYQRILSRHKSFSVNNASNEMRDGERNPDISIQVGSMVHLRVVFLSMIEPCWTSSPTPHL